MSNHQFSEQSNHWLEELWTQLNKMQNNKACGPDGVPVEAIRLLMQNGEDLVLQTMNEALINGMPDIWRSSIITPIFKGKGSAMECSNYRGIKLLCHDMKLYERMVENRLRKQIEISSNQYGFRPGKSTMEPIFALRILQEKYLEKRKELHKNDGLCWSWEGLWSYSPRSDLVVT